MRSLLSRVQARLSLLNVVKFSTLKPLYTANGLLIVIFAVTQAKGLPGTKIVSLDWLLESVEEGKMLDEAQYSFTIKAMDKSAPSSQSNGGKKRARVETPEDNNAQQTASPVSDEAEQPPMKRQKDGQKAKSGSALTIPVDEGCNLACKKRIHTLDQHRLSLRDSFAPCLHR